MTDTNPYSATRGQACFDWRAFLGRNPADIPAAERDAAIVLAKSWVTCAVGNQCAAISRSDGSDAMPTGRPIDEDLYFFGSIFYADVALGLIYGNFSEARRTLLKIEQRSAQILAATTPTV